MRRFLLLPLVALLAAAAPAFGQADLGPVLAARAKAIPKAKRAFQETWLLPESGTSAPDAGATAFAGRATVYQANGRERVEIRRVEGDSLGAPVVVVYDGSGWFLVTRVGATPLAKTAPAGDPLVRMVLAGPAGAAPPHRTIPAPDGGLAAVVLRNDRKADFDPGRAFALSRSQVGGALDSGLASFSAATSTKAVASAGARGVGQVQTPAGPVTVTPDPDAVAWMEAVGDVGAVDLEAFKRSAGLPPYDALAHPEPSP